MRAPWLAAALALPLLAAIPVPGPARAVQPDEVLADPALEARARALSRGLRCPVCRNESIDESNADLARDIRVSLRDRLVAGDSDAEAVAWLVARYGEYVLLAPEARGANLVLWLAGPALLLAGGAGAALYLRGRSRPAAPEALSDGERARLAELTAGPPAGRAAD